MLRQKNIFKVTPTRFLFSTISTRNQIIMPVGIYVKSGATSCSMVLPQPNRTIPVWLHIWGRVPIGELLNTYLICWRDKFISRKPVVRRRTLNLFRLTDSNPSWVWMTRLRKSLFPNLHTKNYSPRNFVSVRNSNTWIKMMDQSMFGRVENWWRAKSWWSFKRVAGVLASDEWHLTISVVTRCVPRVDLTLKDLDIVG